LCRAPMTFLKPDKKLVEAAPTFPALGKLAQTAGVEVTDVPLNKRYEHDLPVMLANGASSPNPASTGLVYIVNPNNHTGSVTRRNDIHHLIAVFVTSIPI